jgi:hypothetical protein
MKTRRTTTPIVCEACETRRALPLDPDRQRYRPFQLCRICSDRAERLSLRPLEWYNLAKRHGPYGPLLGEEYYSPGGAALMSEDELEEEPHLLPAPILQDVAHDLPLLWDHTLTRRELKPKLLAAWRRHPTAVVVAHLTQIWESRQDDHARGHLLTICRDSLGRAGIELARLAWEDYHQFLQAPDTTCSGADDDMDFTQVIDRNLEDSDDDEDVDDDSPASMRPPSRPRYGEWHDLLPSVSARCLPRDEAYQLLLAEAERSGDPDCFTPLRDPRALDWIETHLQSDTRSDWSPVVATSLFSWDRALRWLDRGPPFSHLALDTLHTFIIPYGDPDDDNHGTRLLGPPNLSTLSRVLKAHARRDRAPCVKKNVAFILKHAPVLLEGKPYR